jgi:hypothetical protein
MDGTCIQLCNELIEILCDRLAVIVARSVAGVSKSTEIDCEYPVLRRKQWDQLIESPPGLREP